MATRHAFGSSSIDYLGPGGAPVTHLLGAKLIELQPADEGARYDWWSWNRKVRRIVTIETPVYDLLGTIRYDDEPAALKAMLRHALRTDATLNYREVDGGEVFPLKLVAVVGASSFDQTPIRPDRDRWRVGEYESRIHVRRIDGLSLDALL